MTDEHDPENPEHTDSATASAPRNDGVEPGNVSRLEESEAEESGTNHSSETYTVEAGEDQQHRAAFSARQLFSKAQEQFAAGEFIEANRLLKQIPDDAQTHDIQRLQQLTTDRIREIAVLRSEIQTALNQRKHENLSEKLQRLIELQPGDTWANTIRHRLDEDEHGQIGEVQPIAVAVKGVFTKPRPQEMRDRPREPEPRPEKPNRPSKPEPPRPSKSEPPPQKSMAVEIVEDDAEVDEVWEFGERLVKSSPPPLQQSTARPKSSRPRPSRSRSERPRSRPAAPAAEVEEFEDDFVDWLEPDQSTTGLWIAITVSGMVILLALIATIVVLVLEKGS